MNRSKLKYLGVAFSLSSVLVQGFAGEWVLLTGRIKPGDVQKFTSPWSESYRQQIKWMKPEGEEVKKGDIVIVFDSANLDSSIEQEKVKLRQSQDKAKQNSIKLKQKIVDANHDKKKALLEYRLAKLKASVPVKFRSGLEKDTIDFDYIKFDKKLKQAEIKRVTVKNELLSEQKKQKLEQQGIQATLSKKQHQLFLMQLRADRSGTVIHASHPWTGSQITEGQSVQNGWELASIPRRGNETVEAWVNEVDRPKLLINQAVKLTLDAYPNESFKGKITKLGLQAQAKNSWGKANYYDVNISIIQGSSHELIPGMSVRIEAESHIQRYTQTKKNKSLGGL